MIVPRPNDIRIRSTSEYYINNGKSLNKILLNNFNIRFETQAARPTVRRSLPKNWKMTTTTSKGTDANVFIVIRSWDRGAVPINKTCVYVAVLQHTHWHNTSPISSMDKVAGSHKHRYEYDFVDLREKYDPELLKRYYDELMVPNFGVSFLISTKFILVFLLRFPSSCVFFLKKRLLSYLSG